MNTNPKPTFSETLLEYVEEDLPTLEEIERFASGGEPPKSCKTALGDCASKILFALTRKAYPPREANKLWRAIVKHEQWVTQKLGRKSGVSVAALDYLMNEAGDWDEAVVAEVEQIETLADAATMDGLTGLYTREVFDQWIAKAVAEGRRYAYPISMLMADIDDFKMINDTHGHQTGDDVLKCIGSDFTENLRASDFAARYGGEELVAVLPHTTRDAAVKVAEKIRQAVSERFNNNLGVTISIGVAGWREESMNAPAELIQAADGALYAAKQAGKNCVSSSSEPIMLKSE
jgi:diguanylate cyclase (GGDEF)-like protein